MSTSQRPSRIRQFIVLAVVLLVAATGYVAIDRPNSPQPTTPNTSAMPGASATPGSTDAQIKQLFDNGQSGVQVMGSGTVTRLLTDDIEGDRHQRFILKLASGHTLLIAHNIDIAPRLEGLKVGDNVSFYGEYAYSYEGGTIHWTHHDPGGSHVAGYLDWQGRRYQ